MQTNHHYMGLTAEQVADSRARHGANTLTPPPKTPWWEELILKLKDPIILILLIALTLSIGVSFYECFGEGAGFGAFLEPLGILVAVLLATVVGFLFERNANRKFDALNQVNEDTLVKVIRDGNISQISRKEIVVGDIVILETGEEVPADGLLIEAVSLQINESTLTGEPVARKTASADDLDAESTYPSNYALKGTTVADGHGIMEVDKVGDASEYGKVYEGAQIDNSVETPLNRQLNRLASMITKASYAIAVVIIAGRLAWYFATLAAPLDWILFGGFLLRTIMIAVTVIVVAVPEGLPMSVTLSLALSMKRMLSTNNLVRKMHACETMGAATVICTDKTGTLTQNRMKVSDACFYNLEGDGRIPDIVYEGIAANSTAYLDLSDKSGARPLGNPTEGALLLWLNDKGIDYLAMRKSATVEEQLTFSTERKYMATVVNSPLFGRKMLYVKGAPEILLTLCRTVPVPAEAIHAKLAGYQDKAMRTLGFACQSLEGDGSCFKDGRLDPDRLDLSFMGVVAIADPVRKEVPEAVRACLSAGIDVKIITGDTPGTAKEIGRQIGLWRDGEPEANHMSGTDFAAMNDSELLDRVLGLKIMSRARPMDKQRLVRLLQEKNQVVAVTGDGTNDAPALNAAQVGLSMGDGTSVAKEASDITILDNSFAGITRAVMWGRSLYRNIQRFILFQMTINVAACLIVAIGAFLGTESPLTVTQMLWVNLIMDTFAALALASLPPSERVMADKPRRTQDFIITRPMLRTIVGTGLTFVTLLFGLVQYFKHADIVSLCDFSLRSFGGSFFNFSQGNGLSPYELSLFFTIFVMLQFWNMFNAKAFMTGKSALASIGDSKGFLLVAFVILAGQWLIVTAGGEMFNTTPLKPADWVIITVSTSAVLWVGEAVRLFNKLRSRVKKDRAPVNAALSSDSVG
jgi:Ca2+-transporting ATPase